ncbi:MAG: PRTRC system ThiF family protein [Sulfuricaulis sp.]
MNQIFPTPEHLLTRQVRIQVAGVGGTGSHFLEGLASLDNTLRKLGHPGFEVSVYDPDRVTRASVARQRFTDVDVGVTKADVLCHRINLFYNVNYQAHARALDPHEIHADLLVTCTDSALFRARVGKAFARRNTDALWLDHGNSAAEAIVVLGHLGKPANAPPIMLPNIWNLYPELETMRAADAEEASCSVEQSIRRQQWPVNRLTAIMGLNLLWNMFRDGKLENHGCRIDTRMLTVQPMAIDPAAWAFYGVKNAHVKSARPAPVRRAA